MPTTSTARTRTIVLHHYECEHTGDIARDHADLKAHLSFRSIFEMAAESPEVGASVIETTATDEEINAAITKAETCISGWAVGTKADAREWIEMEESEHAADSDRDDD